MVVVVLLLFLLLQLLHLLVGLFLIIYEVLIRRARRVREGQGGWWRHVNPRKYYFIIEHGHELFIIKLVKLITIVVVVSIITPCIQVGDGIAHRSPVSAAPRRGEVEELVHPRRVLTVVMLMMIMA